MQFLRENTYINQPQHKFLRWVGWSGPTGPDHPDLVFCEHPEQPRSDDPALYQMIRTWEFQCVFSSFCSHLGWFEGTPDDPDTTRKHTTVTFGGGSIYTPSPSSFISLSLFPTNLDSRTLNPPLVSIQEFDSSKETLGIERKWDSRCDSRALRELALVHLKKHLKQPRFVDSRLLLLELCS